MKMKIKKTAKLNTFILTNVKVKPRYGIAPPDGAQNNWRYDAIRLGTVYDCDDAHNEILETMFSMKELNYDKFIL